MNRPTLFVDPDGLYCRQMIIKGWLTVACGLVLDPIAPPVGAVVTGVGVGLVLSGDFKSCPVKSGDDTSKNSTQQSPPPVNSTPLPTIPDPTETMAPTDQSGAVSPGGSEP